ncbi:hypothetical protein [Micromonospora sp. RTP1Z1]|uniref:hypothetical protein n=1 Tax=Micromonospora sp. RTP1Z1 TaxID=2994043 RepID=UPI0029C85AC1|nr:hypothetical protein [Micromonospora sp. RTP1Z1]
MTAPAPLSRDEVDVAIVALGAAHDRISAAMYALDNHPGLAAVRVPGLTGRTGRYAADLTAHIDALWSRFNALGAVLDQVRTLRAQRSRPGNEELAELTWLLRAPVVPVGANGMVLDDATPGAVRLPLMELARQLEAGSADATDRLSVLDEVGSALVVRCGQLNEALARLRTAVDALGPDGAPAAALDRLDERLADAYREASGDPLAVAPGGPGAGALDTRLRELAAETATVAGEIDALVGLRDGYPRRAERLRTAVVEVEAGEEAAARACAAAGEKIANTGLPAVPDAAPALRAQLAQLDQIYRERRWSRLADELAAAERAAVAAVERAAGLRDAADGLLGRRAELRGRLGAYRAKAARLGFAEHTELSRRHRAAEDLLYSSPCDLPAATRALSAYQRYLNDLSERGTT